MDPFKSAIIEATVIGSAIKRPKKLIVVIGMWILLGVYAIDYLFTAIASFSDASFDFSAIIFGLVFGLIGIFFLILATLSTRNYLRYKKEQNKDNS